MMSVRHHHPRIEFPSPNPIVVIVVSVVTGGLEAVRTNVVRPKRTSPAQNLNEFRRRWRRRRGGGTVGGSGCGDLGQAKVGQPRSQ